MLLPLFGAEAETITGIGIGGGLAVVLNFAYKVYTRKQDSEDKREQNTQNSSRELIERLGKEIADLKKREVEQDEENRQLRETCHLYQLREALCLTRTAYLEDILTEAKIRFPKSSGLSDQHTPLPPKGEPR